MLCKYFLGDQLTTGWLFLEMLVAGLGVVIAARILTRLADRFADEWGLGKAFVGMLLLATVTSLPEVVAGATAGAIGAVDMAFGAVYGSCAFNIVIIVIMNLFFTQGGSVLGVAKPTQLLSSSFGIIMIAFSLFAMATVHKFEGHPAVQQSVEITTVLAIVATYILFMWLTQVFERRDAQLDLSDFVAKRSAGLLVQLGLVALLTIVMAWWLTSTGDVLAAHPIDLLGGRTLGRTVVGIVFLAIATSLPEIATSVTAVRMNNLDMALGNVFGSNMFNILVLPVVKIATASKGNRLMMAGDNFSTNANMLAGLLPIVLTGVAIAGIAYRTQRRVFRLGFDSVLLLIVYVLGLSVLVYGIK